MKKGIKVLLMSVAILIVTPTFAQEAMHSDKKEKAKAEMEAMFTQLELNADQKEQVKAILKEERMAMKESRVAKEEVKKMNPEERKVARAKAVLKRDEMQKKIEAKLAEVLTSTQMEKYKIIREERRAEMSEKRKERTEHKLMKPRPADAPSAR